MNRRWMPHLVLCLVGVAIMIYPFTLGQLLPLTCRGQVMGPGDSCAKASGNQSQTYEQRRATADRAAPVIVGVGLLVAVFGGYLAATGYRRSRESVSSD